MKRGGIARPRFVRPIRTCVALLAGLAAPAFAFAIDLAPLWNFADPVASERRFREALATAGGDDALILTTQIARTHGLRRDFERARTILAGIEPAIATAGAEARVRYHLEVGRSWASATHARDQRSPEGDARARAAFRSARETAHSARLDDLEIDAIHMFAFVDTAPADQLRWAQEALAVVQASTQPAAKRWEASVRNNLGYALHTLGRYDEALAEFRAAVALRERGTNAAATRVAWWMVAWTLRAMQRIDEAIDIQSRLEREGDAAGAPDRHVFEELEALHRAKGDEAGARRYAERGRATAR